MKTNIVRKCLREASESIQRAADAAESPGVTARLTGIADQLHYHVEGDPRDPEATATPRPDTLDTIQSTIGEITDDVDDSDVTDHLQDAQQQLVLTIVTLDDWRQKQHQSFATSPEK